MNSSLRVARALDTLRPKRLAFFARKLRLPITPADMVIDIGSGGDPHPRADIIVDRAIDQVADRTNGFRRTAPAVIADIESLPFRDGAFDFSVCAHVLEHVEDPAKAANELSRISRRGYVETPSNLHEKLFPIGWHRWFVRQVDGRLQFVAKESPFLDEDLSGFFVPRWVIDRTLMRFVWDHTDDLFIQHVWRQTLEVEVIGRPAEWFTEEEKLEQTSMGDAPKSSEARRLAYDLASRVRYRRARR
jgi:SAM-dependent methyltransferase